ncbi:hypothetical protein [Catellatospora bangladeshensis]|uniref:Uncharacterized protein n=1 Tax=Catellatospora bangladeshensis TaxID=310355 RepID=A0A8J3JK26_9ACTN|nr:hypothetical protein [Catellatospora bangladeshensis]GIF80445.1 hypothetical protein Cba03nite_17940 [Catellatospora bangladeshensis]
MTSPRITLYDPDGTVHEQPSGGLLWVLLHQLGDLPGGDSVTLIRTGAENEFMQAWRLADGYRLFAQADREPLLAHPVGFDAAFGALLAWNLGRPDWRDACAWRPAPRPPQPDTPPELIRIAYEPRSGRTECIGRYLDGQFWAVVHGTRRNRPGEIGVALFLFGHDGTYVRSEVHDDVPLEQAHALREQLVGQLAEVAYGDIAVRTFSVRPGDVTWELVDRTVTHGLPRVCFYPMDIMFSPPWSGTYST